MQTTPPPRSPVPAPRGWKPVHLILVFILAGLILYSIGAFLRSLGQLALISSLSSTTPTSSQTHSPTSTPTRTSRPSRTPETRYAPAFTPPSFHMETNCFFNSNGVYVCQPLAIDTRPPTAIPSATATPTRTATSTPSPTVTFTPSPTVTFTPTATNTPTPTLLEQPLTQAGISLFSTLCFTGLLILLLVWMTRQRTRAKAR